MNAFNKLMSFQRETELLSSTAERLGWDQETMMPPKANSQHAEEVSVIEGVLHARRSNPQIGEWLSECSPKNEVDRANLRLIKRSYERATKVPARLAQELARVTSLAHGIWAQARTQNDVTAFLPTLKKVIELKQEEGSALSEAHTGKDAVYNALLNDYETGATAQTISETFNKMRPRLVKLRERVLHSSVSPSPLTGNFEKTKQINFARELAGSFGYDWQRGRLDLAVHPFCSGSANDVRITTRVVESDPFNCFYSTIHEVGHACYEQGISPDYHLTPVGRGANVSMGAHESQSRIYENQLGRSRAYTSWIFKRMQSIFGDFGIGNADDFYGTVNRLQPGYIRTEADEVQYNLHVMLRFDLERALIRNELDVRNLEEAWNTRFYADFGIKIDKASNGMLQDVHWAAGLFGYFPTYALGNIYAACLHKKMRQDIPLLDNYLSQGDTALATNWLRENVQKYGAIYEPQELISKACGFAFNEPPDELALLDYLETKFSDIYQL